MFVQPVAPAKAAPAIEPAPPIAVAPATAGLIVAGSATTARRRLRLPLADHGNHGSCDREPVATVTVLYAGNRPRKQAVRTRTAIRALKRSYLRRARLVGSDAGMATAEYAIATLAAVGFAGVLVFLLRSDEVRGFLLTLIRTALALP